MNLTPIKCTINGQMRELMVDPRTSLLELLRSEGLTSIKQACAVGECGACTALIDGYLSIPAFSSPYGRTGRPFALPRERSRTVLSLQSSRPTWILGRCNAVFVRPVW